jgi:nucleotide-binding universal stress UspA family protein
VSTFLQSILVGTDLSDASDAIVRAAAHLAERSGAALHVLHSYDLQPRPGFGEGTAATFFGRTQAVQRALAEQVKRTVPAALTPASEEIAIFVAGRALARRSVEVEADLVVLGPHRGRPFGDAFLGSTADTVVRTVACPCLTVRGELPLPLRRLAVPCDLSTFSRRAIDVAVQWAALFGAPPDADDQGTQVDLIHAVPGWLPSRAPEQVAAVERDLGDEGRRALDALEAGPMPSVHTHILEDTDVAETVLGHVRARGCDLLVVATHGYGAIRRALVGGIAARVSREAPCSVLLVPPETGAFADD